jgi:hypothetical protein
MSAQNALKMGAGAQKICTRDASPKNEQISGLLKTV